MCSDGPNLGQNTDNNGDDVPVLYLISETYNAESRLFVITRLEMFVQGTQIQVNHDTYLALLYLSVSLLSRDTVTLLSSIVNAE